MPSQPIEYVLPTSRSFAGMKRVLFQPFDIGKWFILGFSAWLAGLMDGGGSGGGGGGGSDTSSSGGGDPVAEMFGEFGKWIQENLELAITIGVVLFLLVAAIIIVLMWVASRGKFMFLDNVVHNRAQVAVPWTQFRVHGNSLFRWTLGFTLISLFVVALIGGITALIAVGMKESELFLVPVISGGLVLLVAILVLSYIGMLLEDFVIPVMYRDSLTCTEAWRRFLTIHRGALGNFVLYALWKFLLGLGVLVVILVAGFGTCCIGFLLMAIPYIGAVLLLPVSVFFRFLGPEFLRQFGSDYDILVPVADPMLPHSPGGAA